MDNLERYKNAKIYKIVCNKTGLVYYGSTCKMLCRRIAQHRSGYKRYLNGTHNFVYSYKILENDDYDIVLVEECPCDNKEQLHARERFYIENNECVNKYKPNRTEEKLLKYQSEYYKNNKEVKLKYQNEYYQANKEERLKYQKEYHENNEAKLKQKITCDCGGHYTYQQKSQHFKSQKHQKYLDDKK